VRAGCEVCGSPLPPTPNRVEIDGAVMVVCANCARLGKPVGAPPGTLRRRPGQTRAVPRPVSQPPAQTEYDLDPEYNVRIRQAREKMGLSQEQLGKLINEKPSVIRMVETRKLMPDGTLTRKFMHELKIDLMVPLADLEGRNPSR
jgi:putative transcription factor